jgi:hypothetical protein
MISSIRASREWLETPGLMVSESPVPQGHQELQGQRESQGFRDSRGQMVSPGLRENQGSGRKESEDL